MKSTMNTTFVAVTVLLSGCLGHATPGGSGDGGATLGDGAMIGDDSDMGPIPPPQGPMGEQAAARLLNQGTFGATYEDVEATAKMSYADWFAAQASATPSHTIDVFTTPELEAIWAGPAYGGLPGTPRNQEWLKNVLTGPDQLRQRMAFALSEILVVSDKSIIGGNAGNVALAGYMDLLVDDSLGNFRQLLEDTTKTGAMGIWLSMMGNGGTNLPAGVHADENFAREVMQLFTVGLTTLNLDGTDKLDGNNQPIPTYTQAQVEDTARALTGWGNYAGDDTWGGTNFGASQLLDATSTGLVPMHVFADQHDTTTKTIMGNVVIPAGQTGEQDLETVLDTLFNHPNVGPFLAKQLIKKLVTSNPSPSYVKHVAQTFDDDGTGVRGNLLAVVETVLTDPEARSGVSSNPAFGRLRESPLKMTHMFRAFHAPVSYMKLGDAPYGLFDNDEFSYWPLDSLTVFNYYTPDYQPPGAVAQAGEVAPEFQIITANTIVDLTEHVDFYTGSYKTSTAAPVLADGQPYDGITPVLDTTTWEAVAATPSDLVARMNLVLMSNTMPADMVQVLTDYATGLSDPAQRVVDLADLVLNAPQYAIAR